MQIVQLLVCIHQADGASHQGQTLHMPLNLTATAWYNNRPGYVTDFLVNITSFKP
jgi:hypothetical protein